MALLVVSDKVIHNSRTT